MFRVTYKKEGEEAITPIRKYQIEHCLNCELPALEGGKTCNYEGMQLCVLIGVLDYVEKLYNLKDRQMALYEEYENSKPKPTEKYKKLLQSTPE